MKKWSPGYALLKSLINIWHIFFYKRIYVNGKANIPAGKPIIFAPNHQNALMDALAVIFTSGMQPVFLTRSDIFKNKLISRILTFFKLFPVYRIRDGANNLNKNDEIFDKSVEVLEYGKSMAIFPEAAHNNIRSVRKLKKGIPRVAFIAEIKNNYQLGVKVIPVGIYYSEYQNMKTDLLINYGVPIQVSDFYNLHKENEQKAMAALRDEMEKQIIKLTVNISRTEHYEFYENIRELADYSLMADSSVSNSAMRKLEADQKAISMLENIQDNDSSTFDKLNELTKRYFAGIKSIGIDDKNLDTPANSFFHILARSILFILSVPFHLTGLILNYIPYFFIERFVKNNIRDTQFRSTFRFGINMVVFPFWGLIIGLILFSFINICCSFWILFFGSHILGLFTIRNWFNFKSFLDSCRYFRFEKRNTQEYNKLKELRKEILDTFLNAT